MKLTVPKVLQQLLGPPKKAEAAIAPRRCQDVNHDTPAALGLYIRSAHINANIEEPTDNVFAPALRPGSVWSKIVVRLR